MNDLPRKILCDIIRQNGNAFFQDEKRFRAVLNEHCHGEYKKERRCIFDSIPEGIPETLLKKQGEIPFNILATQLTDRLENSGFSRPLAQWTVESWALAVGIISEDSLIKKTGSLYITTNPAGAEIYLNDRFVGTAPNQMADLSPALYKVRAELIGYHTWSEVIDLKAGQNNTICANLIKETPHGEVSIDSSPRNVMIYLDSQYYGTTPQKITNLKTGSHVLTLSFSGYERCDRNININPGRNPDINLNLNPEIKPQKQPETTQIAVDSYPSKAEIFLDGKYSGVTPQVLKDLNPGKYNLKLRLSGYSDFSTTATIQKGKNPDVFWRFDREYSPLQSRWKTYASVSVCTAAILLAFFSNLPFPGTISDSEKQASATIAPPLATVDPRSNSFFLLEDTVIEETLPDGYVKNYYFEVSNPDVVRHIRIRVEGQSDFDFIVGKEYIPTFNPKRYDHIADIGLHVEELDINNLEKGTYFIAVRNGGITSAYTMKKTTYYK